MANRAASQNFRHGEVSAKNARVHFEQPLDFLLFSQ
jgi:hypothetical protein